MSQRRDFIMCTAAIAACALSTNSRAAQPIRLVIPFAAGGTTDILGRLMADGLARELNVPVVTENLAGANGSLGALAVVRAKPDGTTLMLGTPGPMVVNKYVYDKLPYDPLRDLAPVVLVAELPNVLMVRPGLGVGSVADLVALAKAKPGSLTHGSPGIGSSSHVSVELFKLAAGIQATHIPYKGSVPMITDLMGGSVDFSIDQLSSALKFIQGGQVRALAVTSAMRSTELPDVPTLKESGFLDYEVTVWFCIAAPAKVPAAVVTRLNAALNKVLQQPEVRSRIVSLAATPLGGPPQDLARQISAEKNNILQVLKVVDIKS